jgi:hypothetical protein
MAGFVPFRNICAIMNCIAFKLILFFNSATSYTRKTLCEIVIITVIDNTQATSFMTQ